MQAGQNYAEMRDTIAISGGIFEATELSSHDDDGARLEIICAVRYKLLFLPIVDHFQQNRTTLT